MPEMESKQILNSFENKVEMEGWLSDVIESYIDMRSLINPFYDFNTLTQKWNEYERCYEMRPKAQSERKDYEYKGYSNIMLPDFHEKVEVIRTRELNALFSGADKFNSVPTKLSDKEDAIIAKKLVEYNWDCICDFREENSKIERDKLVIGTWVAYTPWKIAEYKQTKTIDYVLDEKTGKPMTIDGTIQKTEPYEAELIIEKKFTDYEHVDIKKVYVNPFIQCVQDQEAVFVLMTFSYSQLLEMEKDEIIAEGMADYIKEHYSEYVDEDQDLDEAKERLGDPDESLRERDEITAFDLYMVYFRYGEDRKVYEGFYMKDETLVGLREYHKDEYPFIKGCHIDIPDSFYGMGMGDQMYPSYIAKNAAFNQWFDSNAFEVKGGGFKDPEKIPSFTELRPGEYKNVEGLSSLMQAGAKPVLGINEILGKRSADSRLVIMPQINEAIQSGTGATALLAGMPSGSEVDKTATGIDIAIKESNARINTYLEHFEEQNFRRFAEVCYKNYQDYLDPEKDLYYMLDPEDLVYTDDETGEEVMINIKENLMNVDFHFESTQRLVESEQKIGKFLRFLQVLQQFAAVNPTFGQMMIDQVNWKFMLDEVATSLDITDLDNLFPKFNPIAMLKEAMAQIEQLTMKDQAMSQVVQKTMGDLEQQGNQSALQAIKENQAMIDEAMAASMGGMMGEQAQPNAGANLGTPQ